MRYEIEYYNPSSVNQRTWTSVKQTKTEVRAFAKEARTYPGSIEITSIKRITGKGVESYHSQSEF